MVRSIGAWICCMAAAAGPAVGAPQESRGDGVWALLELNQRFYYAGDPFNVRITVGYDGEQQVDNPVKGRLARGFEVRRDGKRLAPKGPLPEDEGERPAKLERGAFYGRVVELSRFYPQLNEVGTYEISWSSGGVQSQSLTVHMIPRYDPGNEYRAVLDTGQGKIEIGFMQDVSPLAVKNFIDLAHAGFYDGTTFHEVRPDWYVVAGDPTGTGAGGPGYSFPAESSALPAVAGTVLMKPLGPAPPANGSQFLILLRPEPSWTGQFTVLGQVVSGLDVVGKISKTPSSETRSRPFHKPLQDVEIRSVSIRVAPGQATESRQAGDD